MSMIIPFPRQRHRRPDRQPTTTATNDGAAPPVKECASEPLQILADPMDTPVLPAAVGAAADVCSSLPSHAPGRAGGQPEGNIIVRALRKIAAAQTAAGSCTRPAPLPDIAWVIRTALPSVARKGKGWSSLPQLHRDLLEKHIGAGDPTAKLFRAWVENRHIPGQGTRHLVDAAEGILVEGKAHDA
ncbi:hypothetical protein [Rhizobium sp. TRM95796]|uniref:hypothetical protein n=1 Tax=Rhizobium sp. TRM95796 TaxID=2979862 RepID=UPI0021E75A92|nr:hypothetical protein [Rhizobium sp. TRM95796]MCV3768733.1 hypothetical protein [Rhizobium sp. TRM95796]